MTITTHLIRSNHFKYTIFMKFQVGTLLLHIDFCMESSMFGTYLSNYNHDIGEI